jgi:hypothetical protein
MYDLDYPLQVRQPIYRPSPTIPGTGLMIYFPQPDSHYGYLIMCQIFLSIGNGFVIVCDEVAAMASTSHQYIAVVLAVTGVFSSVGAVIGGTVVSAIWQSIFPTALAKYLPAADLPDLEVIYGSLTTPLSYPVESDTRLAIQKAYGDAQTMCCLRVLLSGLLAWLLSFSGEISMSGTSSRSRALSFDPFVAS